MLIAVIHQYILSALGCPRLLKSNVFNMVWTLVIGMVFQSAVHALTFHARMDESKWLADSHVLQCQLTQPIPLFGRAVFDQSAGQPLRFYLQSVSSGMVQGQALLTSEAPSWNPTLAAANLGLIKVVEGEIPINLHAALADQLLDELYRGRSPQFIRRGHKTSDIQQQAQPQQLSQQISQEQPITDKPSIVKVGLSSVYFREAYSEYRQCLEQLMPVGFEQLSRSRVHFDADAWQLTPKTIEWLNTIVRYVQADSEIAHLYIDGYTDDLQSSVYNSQLSKKRADSVAAYLVSKGLLAEQITTRFHGERFPVASNKTAEGRSINRRVTIRLDRRGTALSQR